MTDARNHVEATVQQMAELHAEQTRSASRLQRGATRLTDGIAQPWVLILTIVLEAVWIGLNLGPRWAGLPAFDAPPFEILNLVVGTFGFNVTLLILASQRRDDVAARHRAQLTLKLAALSEQKIAKVIALLEEQRRENPSLSNRLDPQADEMANSADPKHVLSRIIDTHEEAEKG